MYEKSSTDNELLNTLKNKYSMNKSKKIIILDSNHTKDHVLKELRFYSKLLNKGDYLIVMDTVIEFINQKFNKKKNFRKGNSPYNATKIFLRDNNDYIVDDYYENKSFLTGARNGFLRKIK